MNCENIRCLLFLLPFFVFLCPNSLVSFRNVASQKMYAVFEINSKDTQVKGEDSIIKIDATIQSLSWMSKSNNLGNSSATNSASSPSTTATTTTTTTTATPSSNSSNQSHSTQSSINQTAKSFNKFLSYQVFNMKKNNTHQCIRFCLLLFLAQTVS